MYRHSLWRTSRAFCGFPYLFVAVLCFACTCLLIYHLSALRWISHNSEEWIRVDADRARPTPSAIPWKYFREQAAHEPGDDEQLGHYDSRFFHGKLQDKERSGLQVCMVQSYLETFRKADLETWLAHGTLLGWWWNQQVRPFGRLTGESWLISIQMLPWDWDIDTQISMKTLRHIAKNFNGTTHEYGKVLGHEQCFARQYLLDVNPHGIERETEDPLNTIDARWIDTSSGLYIDITALGEVHPIQNPGVVSCKNNHDYRIEDLYPLKDTVFETVPAKVPAASNKILVEEYGLESLTRKEFAG